MSVANEIYKKIDVEADACVEEQYSFWKFQPRHKLRPKCYQKAYNKYLPELTAAQANEATLEQELNRQTIEALNNNLTANPIIPIVVLIIAIIIIYLIFF